MSTEPVTKLATRKAANDPSAAPHVIRAINAVTAELAGEGIGKDSKNVQQGWTFRGIDAVLNTLARIIADNKLVIIPHVLSRELVERHTKGGAVLFCVTARVDYTFISAEDGSRETIGPFDGEAMDSADKATNKAMSAAYKYMAIQTFCIPTEGDNDADATTHEVVAGAAGAAPSPQRQQSSSRRVNVIDNPATGRKIDTENAKNQRPEWERFTDKVQGFIEARDKDGLRLWYTSDDIVAYVAGWVFKDEAEEHFDAALDRIAELERA